MREEKRETDKEENLIKVVLLVKAVEAQFHQDF